MQIANIYEAAGNSYSRKPNFSKEQFIRDSKPQGENTKYFGAFEKQSGKLCAFCFLDYDGRCANYVSHKAIPQYEKSAINAALVAGMLEANEDFLNAGGYICDGSRSINHETAFQDYLERYFGFRKAYCKLKIVYEPKIRIAIKVLYPLRNILKRFNRQGLIHNINAILKMEEIARQE